MKSSRVIKLQSFLMFLADLLKQMENRHGFVKLHPCAKQRLAYIHLAPVFVLLWMGFEEKPSCSDLDGF